MRAAPLLLSLPLLAACASARTIEPDERIVHLRAALGASGGEDPRAAVAELLEADGAPPTLTLLSIAPGGAPAVVARIDGTAAADAVRRGDPLVGAAAAAFEAALRDGGFAALPAPAPLPAVLPAPRAGWELATRLVEDRYGEAVAVVLRDGRGSEEVELARIAAPAPVRVSFQVPSATLALATVERPTSPGLVAGDVLVLDLALGASKLHELHALQAHGRQAWDEALLELARAERLAPESPSVPYNRACVLARAGRKAEALAPLGRALELAPSPYAMFARTDPDLDALRGDPAFEELVKPRPLQGTNRAGRVR